MEAQLVLCRLPAVIERYGKRRTAVYGEIERGVFPPPVKLGARVSAWPKHEIDAVLAARIAGEGDDSIRDLVADLIRQRKRAGAQDSVATADQ